MNQADYMTDIENGLKLWLREVHDVKADSAQINESEVERAMYDGCETCGYGGEQDTVSFTISYYEATTYGSVQLDGLSTDFLPELLPYIYRARGIV